MARCVCRWFSLTAAATPMPIPPIRITHDKKTTALPRERITPSRVSRARDPAPGEIEGEGKVNQPWRHPHHQACELLVLYWREPAKCRELALLRIPGLAREREKDAEHSAVQAREEQAGDRNPIAALAQRPVEQRPPEQER